MRNKLYNSKMQNQRNENARIRRTSYGQMNKERQQIQNERQRIQNEPRKKAKRKCI